jgi:hypothetical protein
MNVRFVKNYLDIVMNYEVAYQSRLRKISGYATD